MRIFPWKKKSGLTRKQWIYLQIVSIFFAIMPTRVFNVVASDIIQFSSILIAAVVVFMPLMLTIDISFDLPTPEPVAKKLADRQSEISNDLKSVFQLLLSLVILTIAAKAICLWFIGRGWGAVLIDHFAAWTIGGLAAVCIIRFEKIIHAFGYFAAGAELSFFFRKTYRANRPPSPDHQQES